MSYSKTFSVVLLACSFFFSCMASGEAVMPEPGQPVALVTGSTSGLGLEVAKSLAGQGYYVIVHGRNVDRGDALVAEINGGGSGGARFYRADFASLAEIRRLGRAILDDFERLDVLVNNAGFYLRGDPERYTTEDGYELHFQVNYLAGYILTEMLTPLLEKSAPSRIVNVSSIAQAPVDFDNLMLESDYKPLRAYGQSKLAQIMMTFYLADSLSKKGITINALHPSTTMNTPPVLNAGRKPKTSVITGRDAVLQLINDDVGTGKYFDVFDEERAEEQAYDDEAVARLIAVTRKLASPSDTG